MRKVWNDCNFFFIVFLFFYFLQITLKNALLIYVLKLLNGIFFSVVRLDDFSPIGKFEVTKNRPKMQIDDLRFFILFFIIFSTLLENTCL